MPELQRRFGPQRGPRFYMGQDPGDEAEAPQVMMFVNQLDASTCIGPRKASAEDANEHPEAWAKFASSLEQPAAPAEDDKPGRRGKAA